MEKKLPYWLKTIMFVSLSGMGIRVKWKISMVEITWLFLILFCFFLLIYCLFILLSLFFNNFFKWISSYVTATLLQNTCPHHCFDPLICSQWSSANVISLCITKNLPFEIVERVPRVIFTRCFFLLGNPVISSSLLFNSSYRFFFNDISLSGSLLSFFCAPGNGPGRRFVLQILNRHCYAHWWQENGILLLAVYPISHY